jgi:hypothetical protein
MQMNAQRSGVSATLGTIPDGVAGIRATLQIMKQMVKDGKKSMVIRNKAIALTKHLGQKDFFGEVQALHAYVRDNIRYLLDTDDVELVQTPEATLRVGCGDCDDKTTLLCALLGSIGHPSRFVAVGFSPNVYEHVYCETLIGNTWVACETTEPWGLGQEPPRRMIRARLEWHN